MADTLLMNDKTDENIIKLTEDIKSLSKASEDIYKKLNALKVNNFKINVNTSAAKSELQKLNSEIDNIKKGLSDVEKLNLKSDNGAYVAKHAKESGASANTSKLTAENAKAFAKNNGFAIAQDVGNIVIDGFAAPMMTDGDTQTVQSAFNGAIGGAAMGAALGPLGAVIGGVVGLLGGIITDSIHKYEEKQDIYRDIVGTTADNILTGIQDDVHAGSEIFAARENVKNEMISMIGKDEGERAYNSISNLTKQTSFDFNSITSAYTSMLQSGYDGMQINGLIYDLERFGVSTKEMTSIVASFNQLNGSEIVEEGIIASLANSGIDVYSLLSDNMDIDQESLKAMISSGEMSGREVAEQLMSAFVHAAVSDISAKEKTFTDIQAELNKQKEDLNAIAGESYNEARKKSMQNEIGWYDENSSKMSDMYSIAGEWQAQQDSAQEKYKQVALEAMVNSAEYKTAIRQEDKETLLSLYSQAMASATAQYYNSEEYGSLMTAQEIILKETQGELYVIGDVVEDMYELIDQRTLVMRASEVEDKKIGLTMEEIKARGWTWFDNGEGGYIYDETWRPVTGYKLIGEHATGISRVPYDGYRAILHEGERVITASKAKESERTKGGVNIGNINITASGAINDDETFARMLASQLEKALAAYAV